MLITRRYELDMGHCLPDHEGKCYRPHGHRYVVEASVSGELATAGAERGMVTDFGRIKQSMAEVLDAYDHRFAMSIDDPRYAATHAVFGSIGIRSTLKPPTVEHLAEVWAEQLAHRLPGLCGLRVYETPNCWADWAGGWIVGSFEEAECESTSSTTG